MTLATLLLAGTLIVLNKSDDTASLIHTATREVIATLPTGREPHEAAVSPDGRLAVVANYATNSLTVLDLAGKTRLRDISLGEYRHPHGIVWLRDGRVVVTAEANKKLLVVDIDRPEPIVAAIETGQEISHMVAVTPDGTRAFVPNIGSGSVSVIDLAKRKRIAIVPTGAGAEGIDISPAGKEVWVSNRSADTLTVLDTSTLKVLATVESKSFPIRVKFTPDGKHVLVSNARSGDVAVFDAAARKEVRRIQMEFSPVSDADQRLFGTHFGKSPVPVGILVEPTGKFAYVANTQADVVTVIDLGTWEIADRLVAGREPDGLGFAPAR